MVLVEDNYTANQTTGRTLSVVPNSERSLTYPAVASDVVDRTGTRSTMVVLTRQLSGTTATTSPVSWLRFFDLQNIVPSNPGAFRQVRAIQLTGASGDPFFGTGACFTAVQVSLDGRYATLLNSPAACDPNSSSPPSMFVLDTQNPTTYYDITSSVGPPILDAAPFDDQAQVGEKVYFLVSGGSTGGVNNAEIYTFDVPYDPTVQPADAQMFLPGQDQTELASNGSELVAMTNPDPYSPTNYPASYVQAVPLSGSSQSQQVDTVPGATALAVDPSGATQQVVVAGRTSTGGEITVHPDATSNATATTSAGYNYTGVAATIDPVNRFGYVIDSGQIVVLDLLTVGSGSSTWYRPFGLTLTLPRTTTAQYATTVAWTRAKQSTP
ncbi:MAG: hypothetical protein P8Y05_10840 [Deinococcales bacterium]